MRGIAIKITALFQFAYCQRNLVCISFYTVCMVLHYSDVVRFPASTLKKNCFTSFPLGALRVLREKSYYSVGASVLRKGSATLIR